MNIDKPTTEFKQWCLRLCSDSFGWTAAYHKDADSSEKIVILPEEAVARFIRDWPQHEESRAILLDFVRKKSPQGIDVSPINWQRLCQKQDFVGSSTAGS